MTRAQASAGPTTSPWSPFRHSEYTVLWVATVVANIGSWMYNAASGWLMTSLDPQPLVVSMVQVATTLPMFLFAVPAGALADIVDRRKFLIVAEIAATVFSAIYAAIVSDRSGRRADGAGVANGRAATRSQAGPLCRDRCQ